MNSGKPLVFVSYAHADEPQHAREHEVQWRSWLERHFKPLEKQDAIELFVDSDIPAGHDWEARIRGALARCDVFVLLVSSNSLGSTFIVETEVKAILDRQAANKSTERPLLFPVMISPVDDDVLALYDWLKTRATPDFR